MNSIKNRSLVGNHYTEQYKYIHNENCKIHILKFSNLETDFNAVQKI